MPTGYTASTPTTRSISLTPGEDRTDVDFGAFTTGVLGDRLWHDLDGDGIEDPGEPGLVGVDVRLTGAGAPVIVTTDANGDYSFTGLDPGTYTVDVVGSTLPVGTNSGVALVATTADSLVLTVVSAATHRIIPRVAPPGLRGRTLVSRRWTSDPIAATAPERRRPE